jgi:hypothetical protein
VSLCNTPQGLWCSFSSLIRSPARADLQQMQHLARRRREVDQGATSANRNDVPIAVIGTLRE